MPIVIKGWTTAGVQPSERPTPLRSRVQTYRAGDGQPLNTILYAIYVLVFMQVPLLLWVVSGQRRAVQN